MRLKCFIEWTFAMTSFRPGAHTCRRGSQSATRGALPGRITLTSADSVVSFYLLLRPLPSALLKPLIESFGFLPPRHISGFLLQMISSPRFIESKKKLLFKQSYRIGIQHYIIPSYLHSLFTLFKGGSFHLPSYRYSNEERKIIIPKLKK